jgi:excisionase family DNA binding protein
MPSKPPAAPSRRRKTPALSELMKTAEAVEYARISRSHLYRLAQDGAITRWTVGSRSYWSRSELDGLVRRAGEVVS